MIIDQTRPDIITVMEVTENLLERIFNQCERNQVRVTKDFIFFLIRLYELNPIYQIKGKNQLNYEKLNEDITKKLFNESPSLITLKSQLYFSKHYYERDETIERYRLCLHQKTKALVIEICETDTIESDRDIEKLYEKIVVLITLLSGMGNPTIPSVMREVSIALQSVFQPLELKHYITLTEYEREKQLMELMCIVAGIRLFNKDNQRGGEGIDDLPTILKNGSHKTRLSILDLLELVMKDVYKMTTVVENLCDILPDESDCYIEQKDTPSAQDKQWAVETLSATRQQETYIRKLLNDIEQSENEIKTLTGRLRGRLIKLHDTVRYRTAVPTVQVYSQFIDLADIWSSLQDEVIVLSSINEFLTELQNLNNRINILNETKRETFDKLLENKTILSDADRLEKTMGKTITECGECLLHYPDVTKDFEKINLEFLGFCAWSFVVGQGALIPGNPNNGVAKWRGKYFAFGSIKAAEEFGTNPDKFTYDALNLIRSNAEYIHLFQLQGVIEVMKKKEELTKQSPQLKICRDQMIQTDVHILPPCKYKNYTSNVWELRRKALQMASISRCATSSTQTNESNYRHGINVQAAPPRTKEIQTKRDNNSNTEKLKTFIFGLRGRRDDHQHVVSYLENDLE